MPKIIAERVLIPTQSFCSDEAGCGLCSVSFTLIAVWNFDDIEVEWRPRSWVKMVNDLTCSGGIIIRIPSSPKCGIQVMTLIKKDLFSWPGLIRC